jgi:hypothetical protein
MGIRSENKKRKESYKGAKRVFRIADFHIAMSRPELSKYLMRSNVDLNSKVTDRRMVAVQSCFFIE